MPGFCSLSSCFANWLIDWWLFSVCFFLSFFLSSSLSLSVSIRMICCELRFISRILDCYKKVEFLLRDTFSLSRFLGIILFSVVYFDETLFFGTMSLWFVVLIRFEMNSTIIYFAKTESEIEKWFSFATGYIFTK